jgi:hypothetical protein
MGGCQCCGIEKIIAIILQYIFKFCLVPLHKGAFFSEMLEPQALTGALVTVP